MAILNVYANRPCLCRNSLSRAPGHAPGSRASGLKQSGSEVGYQIFDQVSNRVGKITDVGLKWDKGFRKRAAHPLPIFLEVPPGILGRKRQVIVPPVPSGDRGNWD